MLQIIIIIFIIIIIINIVSIRVITTCREALMFWALSKSGNSPIDMDFHVSDALRWTGTWYWYKTLQYRLTPLSMPERPVFANDNEAVPPDVT